MQKISDFSDKVTKFRYFKNTDFRVDGIRFGNWGSRPYEYFWVAAVENAEGKDILDIGTGTPTEHNWHEFVAYHVKPKSYLGIDFDDRLKKDCILLENHRVVWMDASSLDAPDDSFDIIYSISTFEHIDSVEKFMEIMSECRRVLRPGGKMIVTLDEYWDNRITDSLPWNELEKAYVRGGKNFIDRSYGMVDFASDIAEMFRPVDEVPVKKNADDSLLYSRVYNDCISYGVFEVIK